MLSVLTPVAFSSVFQGELKLLSSSESKQNETETTPMKLLIPKSHKQPRFELANRLFMWCMGVAWDYLPSDVGIKSIGTESTIYSETGAKLPSSKAELFTKGVRSRFEKALSQLANDADLKGKFYGRLSPTNGKTYQFATTDEMNDFAQFRVKLAEVLSIFETLEALKLTQYLPKNGKWATVANQFIKKDDNVTTKNLSEFIKQIDASMKPRKILPKKDTKDPEKAEWLS